MIVKQIKVPATDKRKTVEILTTFMWDFDYGEGSGPFEYFEISLWDEEDFETVLDDLRNGQVRVSRVREKKQKERDRKVASISRESKMQESFPLIIKRERAGGFRVSTKDSNLGQPLAMSRSFAISDSDYVAFRIGVDADEFYQALRQAEDRGIAEVESDMRSFPELHSAIRNIYESKEKMRTIKIKEEFRIPGTNVILEAGDRVRILETVVSKKDWDRMVDLYLSKKDGAGVARAIKDKDKAVARYVAGIKIASLSNELDRVKRYYFTDFYDKAISLGATEEEIQDTLDRTDVPREISDKIEMLKTKKYSNRFVGDFSKEIIKMGFDIEFLPHNGNAITYEGKAAMRRSGLKWTIGYKTLIDVGEKKIRFNFDAITNEAGGPTYYAIQDYEGSPKGKREFMSYIKNKLLVKYL